jgi:hypothetical protein
MASNVTHLRPRHPNRNPGALPATPRPDFTALAAIFPHVEAAAIAAEDRVRAQLAVTSLDAGLTTILGLPR